MSFQKVFSLENSRFLDKRRVFILLAFYLVAVYFVQTGIGQYKSNTEEIKRFQEFEKNRVANFQYYDQYGTYGFRMLFIPSSLSAFFYNAGIFTTNLNAFIDAGERMNIYEPFKDKNIFIGYTSIFLNQSGLLLLLGSALALLYGFESYRDRYFIKFLASLRGSRKSLFWSILASRLILLLVSCFIITLTAWLLFLVNGVPADGGNLIIYGLVFFLMLAFFLLAGLLAGTMKKRRAGLTIVFSVWILFVFGFPAMVSSIVYNRAMSIKSAYEMDIEKFNLMMTIEKKAKDQAGQMKRDNTKTEIRQKLYEYFWNNEFKEILNHEQNMINDMKGVVSFHHNLRIRESRILLYSVSSAFEASGIGSVIGISLLHVLVGLLLLPLFLLLIGCLILTRAAHSADGASGKPPYGRPLPSAFTTTGNTANNRTAGTTNHTTFTTCRRQ